MQILKIIADWFMGFMGREPVPVPAGIGRNEPCHCGSGSKYKHCCLHSDQERLRKTGFPGCCTTST